MPVWTVGSEDGDRVPEDDGSEDEETEGRAETAREGEKVDGLPERIPIWTVGGEDGDSVSEVGKDVEVGLW
jgi:hypothetical protein